MSGPDLLASFVAVLNAKKIAYMVVGSFSSNYHGVPRSTKDADIVLEFDNKAWTEFAENLPEGMSLDLQGGFEMVTATRREVIYTDGSLFEIEVFHLTDDEFDQERFRRRIEVDLGQGVSTWIASAEDAIVQKLRWLAGARRSKDFDDVVKVLFKQGEDLDFGYIESWCAKHGSLDILAEAREEAS